MGLSHQELAPVEIRGCSWDRGACYSLHVSIQNGCRVVMEDEFLV